MPLRRCQRHGILFRDGLDVWEIAADDIPQRKPCDVAAFEGVNTVNS
jgi:hypothetical protein